MDYKKILEGVVDIINTTEKSDIGFANICAYIGENCPELKESEDERIRKDIIVLVKDWWDRVNKDNISTKEQMIAWLEKQGSEPNWCHHKVDLSECSEEYRKAYYDGWNNCNMQHSQCKSELDDVVKCLINGMKFYYEDNKEATWGTDKWSMPVKHIIEVLEKQDKQKPTDKVEPKFKVGDKIQYLKGCGTIMTIEKIENGEYIFGNNMGHTTIESGNKWHLVEQKSAWSEEDEKILSNIIKDLVHPWNEYIPDRIEDEIKWLKNKLKPLRPQKQDVISEDEFRHIVGYLVQDIVANEHMAETEKQPTKFFVEKYYKKLRHQNTWKPSDEQIKAVKEAACYSSVFSEKTIDNLISLNKDLKKLKG